MSMTSKQPDYTQSAAEDSEEEPQDQGWLEGKSEAEILALLLDLALELKGRRHKATDKVFGVSEPPDFSTVNLETEVKEFVRLPAFATRYPAEVAVTTAWRIILYSVHPDHEPLGLEIYDDVIFGRAEYFVIPDVDLTKYDGEELGVSRQHAMLRPTGDSLELIDLVSSNGTYVNGTRLERGKHCQLQHNDTVGFGSLYFMVKIVGRPKAPAA